MKRLIILLFSVFGIFGLYGQHATLLTTVPSGAAPVVDTFLLDSFPANAAYSLRCLKYNHLDSAAIRVRRSSDNTEQDIGFTAQGYLDTASMKTFVGANSGYVVTWYDQSGNEFDFTQGTAANQPRIINAGTVDRKNGKPTIKFTNSTITFLRNDSLAGRSVFYPFLVYDSGTDTEWTALTSRGGAVTGISYIATSGSSTSTITAVYGTPSLYVNNALETPSNRGQVYTAITGYNIIAHSNASTSTWPFVKLFGYDSASLGLDGHGYEFVFYFTDQDSNRSAIFNSINRHYSIY